MRLCFDLDETLCVGYPYDIAQPIPGRAMLLKQLKVQGHTIVIYTARGMGRTNNQVAEALKQIESITLKQLSQWDFVFDEIWFGKPSADIYIDDKAISHVNNLNILLGAKAMDKDINAQLLQASLDKIESSLMSLGIENRQADQRLSSMERQLAVSTDSMKNFWDREWKSLLTEVQLMNQKLQLQLNMQQTHQNEVALLKQRMEHVANVFDEKIRKLEKDSEEAKMQLWKMVGTGAGSGAVITVLIEVVQMLLKQ